MPNIKFKDLLSSFSDIEDFLNSSEIGNIFYSEQWCNFLNSTKHSSVFAYGVENDKEELITVLVGAVESNFFWPNQLTKEYAVRQLKKCQK